MPAGREEKLAEPFSFAFLRSVGTSRSGFRWLCTLDGGAFGTCMPACREDERTELLFLRLRISISPDRRALVSGDLYNWRRRFWWIHASGAGGEARCAVFSFTFAVEFLRSERARGSKFDGSLPSAAALLVYAYQRVGRANGVKLFFALPLLNFPGPGSGGF